MVHCWLHAHIATYITTFNLPSIQLKLCNNRKAKQLKIMQLCNLQMLASADTSRKNSEVTRNHKEVLSFGTENNATLTYTTDAN